MGRLPLISVIIPTYNAAGRLAEAVESVRRQQYEPLEIIVVDDGSDEPVAPLVKTLGPDIVCVRQENRGPAAARNAGLKAARGEWIAFLDADDLWPEDKLAAQGARLHAAPELDAVLGRVRYVCLDGAAAHLPPSRDVRSDTITSVFLGSMLARRRAFERIGEFDETLKTSEDQDWFLRAREQRLNMVVLNRVTLLYRVHSLNMTRGKRMLDLQVLDALHRSIQRRRQSGEASGILPPWSSYLEKSDTGNPLVSVIIPAFNGERFVGEAIRSALAQDYAPLEIIVVDDGSTDRTVEVARSFSGVRVIEQENRGPGAARNQGIAAANGELLAFLDQDDLWAPGKIRVQVRYLLDHPEAACVLGRQKRFLDGVERPTWLRANLVDRELDAFDPGVLMARRSTFLKFGHFDTSFVTASDSEWFIRAQDAGMVTGRIPETLLLRRIHGKNQSSDLETIHRELMVVARASVRRKIGLGRGEHVGATGD